MRFMLMLKSDESTPAGPPPPALFAAIGAFGQEAVADGSLVDQGGLLPSATGALVSLVNGSITATDGPFTESKELVGGYAVFDVRSREEAVQKARRFLQIHADNWPGFEGICEVRQIAQGGPEG